MTRSTRSGFARSWPTRSTITPTREAILERVNRGGQFYARREPGEETPALVRGDVLDNEPEIEFSVGFPDDPPAFGELAGTRDLMGTIALADVLAPPRG